jgi:hypothetical protein
MKETENVTVLYGYVYLILTWELDHIVDMLI